MCGSHLGRPNSGNAFQSPRIAPAWFPDIRRSQLSNLVETAERHKQNGYVHQGVNRFAQRHILAFAVVPGQIGRASCRERVCQYVSISVVAVSLKKKNDQFKKTSEIMNDKLKISIY